MSKAAKPAETSGCPCAKVRGGDLEAAEAIYAQLNDANSVVGAIDSGLFREYRGKDRAAWEAEFKALRVQLAARLAALSAEGSSASDARVLGILRAKLESLSDETASEGSDKGRCADAARKDLALAPLSAALAACFTEIANDLEFEGQRIDRATALGKLGELDEPARRKALFLSFVPLWKAVNGANEADSPYRRLMALAASSANSTVGVAAGRMGSPIDTAARTLGVTSAEVEQWLLRILEAWRETARGSTVEPWDYRYAGGAADRAFTGKIAVEDLLEIDHRYYRNLGVDLGALGVLYDLAPRQGKSSVAYTDFLLHGRQTPSGWQPTVARVLATYREGSLGLLNELVHENGHAAHISAIRNRPAYVDWNDDLFVEAFADVASWSLYEPAWQRKYLGSAAPEGDSLRALFGNVMLDAAWALFETRMLREPSSDPNAMWTEITSRYLHIAPHPELAWWVVRVQLVEMPGYMVNYGLGAVLTADLRQRIAGQIGAFDTGNLRWYPWLSENLLRFGSERSTPELLQQLLGRPVSVDALLAQIRRMGRGNSE